MTSWEDVFVIHCDSIGNWICCHCIYDGYVHEFGFQEILYDVKDFVDKIEKNPLDDKAVGVHRILGRLIIMIPVTCK